MKFETFDIKGMEQLAHCIFSEILSFNLTKNTYRILRYDITTIRISPDEGVMDDMIDVRIPFLAEPDRELFINTFSRKKVLEAFENTGQKKFELVYRRLEQDQKEHWMETIVVILDNSLNDDVIGLAVSRNMDSQKIEEERLRESLKVQKENARLKMNEKILELVSQHSERNVIYYDLKTKKAKFWVNTDGVQNQREFTASEFFRSRDIPKESIDTVIQILKEVEQGSLSGQMRISGKIKNDKRSWVDLQYSAIHDEQETPTAVLFSYADITAQYEQEMNHLYYTQTFECNREKILFEASCDLTDDLMEKIEGIATPPGFSICNMSQSQFNEQILVHGFLGSSKEDAIHYLSREHLLSEFEKGNRHLNRVWRMQTPKGEAKWVNAEISMAEDPYNGHVKGQLHLMDVTDEYEEWLEMQRRSDHDSMTGLLNRGASERQIRDIIRANGEKGGILILVDMDNLKGVNDTLGHMEGDKAICAIASTLKGHFRSNDIIGRLGGDEFVLFLPKAAGNVSSIASTLSELLKKLSKIFVGENKERNIQCSIGCTEQKSPFDSFETLYKQADTALYHVKRNGKCSFAFYKFAMELENAGKHN